MIITSETTDFNIVRDVMKNTPLLSLKLRWDWKEWDWLYVFSFNGKWMYNIACDPVTEFESGSGLVISSKDGWSFKRGIQREEWINTFQKQSDHYKNVILK